jgi:bifunctional non-homologous end joining protein LigD
MSLPRWIEPQLCKLATKAPSGPQWVHEIKLDGYRMAARIEDGMVKLPTRSGLDWTAKYPATAAAFAKLKVTTTFSMAGFDGVTSFELIQQGRGSGLVNFAFGHLELDGEDTAARLSSNAKSSWLRCSESLRRGRIQRPYGGDDETSASVKRPHTSEFAILRPLIAIALSQR